MDYSGSMVESSDPRLSSAASRVLLVLGQTPFPVELVDRSFSVLYCNVAYATTFLEKPSGILDRPSRVFPERVDETMDRLQLLQEVERNGLWKGELLVSSLGGRQFPVRLRVFPIHDPAGAPIEFAIYYEDISQEVEARESLVHQQNLLAIRSRQAQMGELLSMIAHQWRQPLTVVMSLIGNIQLKAQLGAAINSDYLKTKLEKMAQNVQFLSDTIDAFRNFHVPSKHKSVEDLGTLVVKALDLVSPSLHKFGIRVEVVPYSEPLPISGYGGEVQQLVLELVNNARDALAAGSPTTPTLRFALDRHDTWAVLRVTNNGVPIPAEVLPRIFDPYYSTKDSSAGAGLGLYMARTIVETHHGGQIVVESRDGWTCFTSRFPLEVAR